MPLMKCIYTQIDGERSRVLRLERGVPVVSR